MAIIEQVIPKEKEQKLREISLNTFNEVLVKLKTNNRVLVVRPTGFGKSFMLTGLTSDKPLGEYTYKKCLYVYPTSVIKQDVINTYGPNGKDERANRLQNTTFISYMKLTNMYNDLAKNNLTTIDGLELYPGIIDISSDGNWTDNEPVGKIHQEIKNKQGAGSLRAWFKEFDLIMLDECHRAGSDGFLNVWSIIKSLITEAGGPKLVGVTATPDRLDGVNIREVFGKRNEISSLTLKDCIKNNLLSKFDYVYIIGDRRNFLKTTVSDINARRKTGNNNELREYEIDELNSEMNKIPSISDIIHDSVSDKNTGGSNYMKFVVFFRDRQHIQKEKDKVESWFVNAFKDKEVVVHNIVSKNNDDSITYEITDIDQLSKLEPRENVVDLIFCVDKLNMGYHVESITGVMLLRETASAVVYNQQIGRCFSVRSMNKPIIFDVIDKCGAGTIIENSEKDKSSGEKKELPSILDKECVDVHNYSGISITDA